MLCLVDDKAAGHDSRCSFKMNITHINQLSVAMSRLSSGRAFVLPVLFWCLHLLWFHITSCLWVFSRHWDCPVLHLCLVIPSSLCAPPPSLSPATNVLTRFCSWPCASACSFCLCLLRWMISCVLNPIPVKIFALFNLFCLESCILVQCVRPCHGAASHFFVALIGSRGILVCACWYQFLEIRMFMFIKFCFSQFVFCTLFHK